MKKMAMPGAHVLIVTARAFGINVTTLPGLLVLRVPSDEFYDDDERDRCSVLLPGHACLSVFLGSSISMREKGGE